MQRLSTCILLGTFMLCSSIEATSAEAQTVAAQRASAAAFRVDTDVYEEGKKEPAKQTLTLFSQNFYYDFAMDDTQAVTVIDPLGGRIIMLSPKRKLKTTFNTAQLLQYLTEARQKLANNKELASVLASASKVSFDEETNTLRVGDEALMYEAKLQKPEDVSMALQYADFADWSARLNAVLPPNFLPYVRLELNAQIASRQQLPETISRISKHNGQTTVWRSQLIANGCLSTEDVSRVEQVGVMLQMCKEVSKEEFFSAPAALLSKGSTPGSGAR